MAKNDHLVRYTEAAISLLGGSLPDIVYLPPDIRDSKRRISADGLVTEADYGEQEIIKRIAAADPAGLLIAIMNGQPIPAFRIVQKGEPAPKTNKGGKPTHKHSPTLPQAVVKVANVDGADVYMEYYTPTLGHRERIAQYLMSNLIPIKKAAARGNKPGPLQEKPVVPGDDYKAIVERRAREHGEAEEPAED